MSSKKQQFSSLLESYKISLEIAGKHGKLFKRSLLLFILAYTAQGLAFSCFYPLLNTIFIDNFDLNNSIFWLSIMMLLSIIAIILKWFALEFAYSHDIVDVTHDLRLGIGNKLKTMPLESLNKYRTGELNSVLAGSVDESVLHMGVIAGMFLEATVVPIVVIAITFFINWKIALAIVVILPFSIPIYRHSRKISVKNKSNEIKANATLSSDIIEYIQGIVVLRSINQIGVNAKNLQASVQRVRQLQKNAVTSEILPMIMIITLIEFVFILVLSLGALLITGGSFTVASLIALLVIITRLSDPISNFLIVAGVLDTMETSFKKIKIISSINNLKIKKPIQKPKSYGIIFKNIDFSYHGYSHKALKNISFSIKSNSLTAIVGVSGSGKTTITKLIMRYADPSNGYIKIGEIDIKSMVQKELMSHISVVFQDVYLFDDSILNNIRMGKLDASDEEVIDAANLAYCHEFISKLPKAYETKVGELGGSLSGGERQRISIARAILKNSPIVILDEPTSALDTQSEVFVQNAIDSLIKNKTVIVISHRLSIIDHADNILVIDNGELKEEGTHNELIKLQGNYYAMHQAQQRIKKWKGDKILP